MNIVEVEQLMPQYDWYFAVAVSNGMTYHTDENLEYQRK